MEREGEGELVAPIIEFSVICRMCMIKVVNLSCGLHVGTNLIEG